MLWDTDELIKLGEVCLCPSYTSGGLQHLWHTAGFRRNFSSFVFRRQTYFGENKQPRMIKIFYFYSISKTNDKRSCSDYIVISSPGTQPPLHCLTTWWMTPDIQLHHEPYAYGMKQHLSYPEARENTDSQTCKTCFCSQKSTLYMPKSVANKKQRALNVQPLVYKVLQRLHFTPTSRWPLTTEIGWSTDIGQLAFKKGPTLSTTHKSMLL